MDSPIDPAPPRRQAGVHLAGAAAALILVALLVAAVFARTTGGEPPDSPGVLTRAEPPMSQNPLEHRLATRPMRRLPPEAALPQPLTTRTAGPAIALPAPGQLDSGRVPSGFPATDEGALARLVAVTEHGLRDGTPDAYARLYGRVSEPGAPRGDQSWLALKLRAVYSSAAISTTEPVGMRWHPTHGLVKGSTSGGEYVVVCVLGELSVAYQGQTLRVGLGDCQALRYTGRGWLIASGVPAAPAPSAWPGSAECVAAGYRELTR